MSLREKMSWFIHQKIVGRFYAVQFYVTALNTFDGCPSGVCGIIDAEKVTSTLLKQSDSFLKRKPHFGLMSRSKAIAKSFVLMAKFWYDCTKQEEKEKERHLREKQSFVKLLLENNVPIPLVLIFGNNLPVSLPGMPVLHTLQDLMRSIEQQKILPELNVEVVYDPVVESTITPEERARFAQSMKGIGPILLISRLSDLGLDSWLDMHLSTS